MDSILLDYFLVAAEEEHMTRAARRLNISQPALSAAVRRLEDQLGCEVFCKEGRGIRLTPAGEVVFRYARQEAGLRKACMDDLEQIRLGRTRVINIVCSDSPSNNILIDYLLKKNFRLSTMLPQEEWEQSLLDGRVDFVLTFASPASGVLSSLKLNTLHPVAVTGPGNPLLNISRPSLNDLNRLPMCCRSSRHSIMHALLDQNLVSGFHPDLRYQGRTYAEVLRYIEDGSYVSVLAREHLPKNKNVTMVPVEDFSPEVSLNLYWYQPMLTEEARKIKNVIVAFYKEDPLFCQS